MFQHYTFFKGKGHSYSQRNAYDEALTDAGIGEYNLIKTSGVLPKDIVRTNVPDTHFIDGDKIYVVMNKTSSTYGDISSGIGVAMRSDNLGGYVVEDGGEWGKGITNLKIKCELLEIGKSRHVPLNGFRIKTVDLWVDDGWGCVVAGVILW